MKNNKQNSGDGNKPNEIPEKGQSEHEGTGYIPRIEEERQTGGSDASYNAQSDVTPPNKREFPSVGNPKTDFVSRNHGRTTGRMIGHEPGTE